MGEEKFLYETYSQRLDILEDRESVESFVFLDRKHTAFSCKYMTCVHQKGAKIASHLSEYDVQFSFIFGQYIVRIHDTRSL